MILEIYSNIFNRELCFLILLIFFLVCNFDTIPSSRVTGKPAEAGRWMSLFHPHVGMWKINGLS